MNRRTAALIALATPWLATEALAQEWASRPDEIALLAYPEMTALDLVGPQYMFGLLVGAKVHIVAKSLDPVLCDTGITILPTATFASCPARLTVLFVPGGTGAIAPMHDPQTLAFVADRGSRAKYVTSVCTGALILAAAGLLRGYRATTHWSVLDALARFGAQPVHERVVVDRNRITGGGVTAGIDFGLAMIAMLRDDFYAQSAQLLAEYNPHPPFDAGSPQTAPPAVTAKVRAMLAPFINQAH